jgi:hypothetical protein
LLFLFLVFSELDFSSRKMSPFIQQCLSRNVVKALIKSRDPGLDYNKAIGNVTALYRSALGSSTSSEPQIPLPFTEKPRTRPEDLTDVEIEKAILPLFDYFDANLQTLNTYLSDSAKEMVMTRVWKEILVIIEVLLIPPLSEVYSDMKPLSDKEVDIVFKWLKVSFFFSFSLRWWCKNIEVFYIVVPSRLLLCQRGRSGTIGSSTESEIQRCCFDTVVL